MPAAPSPLTDRSRSERGEQVRTGGERPQQLNYFTSSKSTGTACVT